MRTMDIVSRILLLPRRFSRLENMTIHSLLKETGYFEIHEQIDEDNIHEALIRHPEYINEWMLWSKNKRSSGWYFRQEHKVKYIVGCFLPAKGDLHRIEYSDPGIACAAYIKHEIEDIRTS